MQRIAKPQKIRVLQYIDRSGIGGTQDYLITIIRGLDREQFSSYVVCPPGPLVNKAARYQSEIIQIPKRRLRDPRSIYKLYRILKREDISIIHTHTFQSSIIGRIAALLAGVPVRIFSMQGYILKDIPMQKKLKTLDKLKNSLLKALVYSLDNFCSSAVILPSFEDGEEMVKRGIIKENKMFVIHNSIDVNLFTPSKNKKKLEKIRNDLGLGPDKIVVSTIARLVEQKGIKYLVQAVKYVKEDIKDRHFVFLLIGDGPERRMLENLAKAEGVKKHIFFLGSRKDLRNLLDISDIFVLPSLWEGLPLVLLMAMSMELPAVATNVNGVKDVITINKNGVIVQPKNPKAIAREITRLIRNPELQAQYGKEARKTIVGEYNDEIFQRRMNELYLQLISEWG